MSTYEGICKYCGSMQPIIAENQFEADKLISKTCNCKGAEEEEKIERICENAEAIAEGLEPAVKDMLTTVGCMIHKGVMNKVSVKVENITLTVSINSNDQVVFSRKETTEKKLQD